MPNCPTCGLEAAPGNRTCSLCNTRLTQVRLRARHFLAALLVIELWVSGMLLTRVG